MISGTICALFFTIHVLKYYGDHFSCPLIEVFLITEVCLLWHTAPLSKIHNAQSPALIRDVSSVRECCDPNWLTA